MNKVAAFDPPSSGAGAAARPGAQADASAPSKGGVGLADLGTRQAPGRGLQSRAESGPAVRIALACWAARFADLAGKLGF